MTVVIGKAEHKVRHNYLHRNVARLVLEVKAMDEHCTVQFNVMPDKIEYNKNYNGYFCSKIGNKQIKFKLKK